MTIQLKLFRRVFTLSLAAMIAIAGLAAFGQAHSAAAATKADNILNLGKKYMGVKYRFGAPSGTTSSFDCSSFTQYIFGKYGIKLPRTSGAQSKKGSYVSKANLKKGDLVFFSVGTPGKVNHVAVYAGNNKILHTYGAPGVTYSSLSASHWKSHYITARRVL